MLLKQAGWFSQLWVYIAKTTPVFHPPGPPSALWHGCSQPTHPQALADIGDCSKWAATPCMWPCCTSGSSDGLTPEAHPHSSQWYPISQEYRLHYSPWCQLAEVSLALAVCLWLMKTFHYRYAKGNPFRPPWVTSDNWTAISVPPVLAFDSKMFNYSS